METTLKLPSEPKRISSRWLPSLDELDRREQGFAQGYTEGWKKAAEDCRKEMEERIRSSREKWDHIARSLNAMPKVVAEHLKEQLVDIAFEAVHKIILSSTVTREEVVAQVSSLLEHAEAGAKVTVQLHPEDLELMTAEERGALWHEDLAHLQWEPNPSIPRGGCVLTGEFGTIDGRRMTRFKKLEQRAMKTVRKDPHMGGESQ